MHCKDKRLQKTDDRRARNCRNIDTAARADESDNIGSEYQQSCGNPEFSQSKKESHSLKTPPHKEKLEHYVQSTKFHNACHKKVKSLITPYMHACKILPRILLQAYLNSNVDAYHGNWAFMPSSVLELLPNFKSTYFASMNPPSDCFTCKPKGNQ